MHLKRTSRRKARALIMSFRERGSTHPATNAPHDGTIATAVSWLATACQNASGGQLAYLLVPAQAHHLMTRIRQELMPICIFPLPRGSWARPLDASGLVPLCRVELAHELQVENVALGLPRVEVRAESRPAYQ